MDLKKKPRVEFEEGCFDDFEGTQEELDQIISEIQRMVDSGEFFENFIPIAQDEFEDELNQIVKSKEKRRLQ